MTRGVIKSQLLENAVFSLYIEQEPYIRELLEAYINSNFKTVLELLSKYSVCHRSLPVPHILWNSCLVQSRAATISMCIYVSMSMTLQLRSRTMLLCYIFSPSHPSEYVFYALSACSELFRHDLTQLDRMSEVFGWTVDIVEQHVVNLIQSGEIQGRVDSQNKVNIASEVHKNIVFTERSIM